MRLLRLARKAGLPPSKLVNIGEIWALDTPVGRAALENLELAGNRQFGPGSHWIEVRDEPDQPTTGLISWPWAGV